MKQRVEKKLTRNIERPGVHAKTKIGTHKRSKLYKKPYKGQGR